MTMTFRPTVTPRAKPSCSDATQPGFNACRRSPPVRHILPPDRRFSLSGRLAGYAATGAMPLTCRSRRWRGQGRAARYCAILAHAISIIIQRCRPSPIRRGIFSAAFRDEVPLNLSRASIRFRLSACHALSVLVCATPRAALGPPRRLSRYAYRLL